jgi:hypothetical protein
MVLEPASVSSPARAAVLRELRKARIVSTRKAKKRMFALRMKINPIHVSGGHQSGH